MVRDERDDPVHASLEVALLNQGSAREDRGREPRPGLGVRRGDRGRTMVSIEIVAISADQLASGRLWNQQLMGVF